MAKFLFVVVLAGGSYYLGSHSSQVDKAGANLKAQATAQAYENCKKFR